MFSIKDTADTSILIKRERASDEQGWMLWGLPVAISEKYRFCLLHYLFEEHHGICHMNSLTRGYFWWSGLDAAIVERVQLYQVCAALSKYPPRAPISTLRNGLLSKGSVCALISLRRAS